MTRDNHDPVDQRPDAGYRKADHRNRQDDHRYSRACLANVEAVDTEWPEKEREQEGWQDSFLADITGFASNALPGAAFLAVRGFHGKRHPTGIAKLLLRHGFFMPYVATRLLLDMACHPVERPSSSERVRGQYRTPAADGRSSRFVQAGISDVFS